MGGLGGLDLSLYQCSVADLLTDCPDYRHLDSAHACPRDPVVLPMGAGTGLAASSALLPGSPDPGTSQALEKLALWLEVMDAEEIATSVALWMQQSGSDMGRRDLLLKLSAGLSLAAADPALNSARDDSLSASPRSGAAFDRSTAAHGS